MLHTVTLMMWHKATWTIEIHAGCVQPNLRNWRLQLSDIDRWAAACSKGGLKYLFCGSPEPAVTLCLDCNCMQREQHEILICIEVQKCLTTVLTLCIVKKERIAWRAHRILHLYISAWIVQRRSAIILSSDRHCMQEICNELSDYTSVHEWLNRSAAILADFSLVSGTRSNSTKVISWSALYDEKCNLLREEMPCIRNACRALLNAAERLSCFVRKMPLAAKSNAMHQQKTCTRNTRAPEVHMPDSLKSLAQILHRPLAKKRHSIWACNWSLQQPAGWAKSNQEQLRKE